MSREVEYGIRVTAKDELSAPVARAEKSVEEFDKTATKASANTSSGFARAASAAQSMAAAMAPAVIAVAGVSAAFGAVSRAAGFLVNAVSDVVRLAMEQERVERRAIAAIESRVNLTHAEFAALQAANAERQRALGIGDETQLQVQGTLAALGVQKQALNAATEATIGLADVTGQGLGEAAKAVGKALTGNVGILKEYGIEASSVADASEQLGSMFRVAMAQADTLQSRLTSLEAAYGDLKEEIGKVVTDSAAVRQGIEALTIAVQDLTSWFSSPEGKRAAKLFFAEIAGGAGDAINAILGAKRALQDLSGQGDRSSFLSRAGGAADVFFQSIDIPAYLIANATGRMKEAQAQYDDAWRRMMGIGGPRPEESPLMQTLEQLANRLQNVAVQARKTSNQITLPDILIPIPDDGPRKPINETQGGATRRSEPMGPPRELFEAYEKEQEAIDKLFAEADAAKARANERAIEREREAAQKIADARAEVEQRAMEAERARIAEYAGFWRAALSQVTDLFGNAWGTIGKLQTKTTTEIVRNEKGMLEERTVMTEQYIGTVGTALGQFLGDAASMFAKAALNFIATKAVEAAAGMITSAISTLGLAGLLIAPAAAAVAMGLVAATKSQVPPPPKFFTGGRVPGPLGAPRVAIVEGGERVVSVADSIDQRGSRGGSVVVQQQLLVAPSRVSMERANRDSILPALRRMQRLGMAT